MLRTRGTRFWSGVGGHLLPRQRAIGTLQTSTTLQPHSGNGSPPNPRDDGNDANIAALREHLEYLQAIIAANIDPIVMVNAAGRIIEFNAAAERTFGYCRDQAIGALFVELLVPPAQRTGIVRPDQCALFDSAEERAGGRRLEIEALCADGSTIPCELTIIPLPAHGSGRMPAFVGFMRDLTAEKATAAALHRERELLHTLFENLPDFIYFKDTAGRFLRVNRAQAANLGCADPNDVVGKTDFDFYPAEMAEQFAEEERHLLATGKPLINHLERQSAEGAPERWALTTKVPVRGPDGVIIGLVGVTRDITELKQAQDALRASETHLRLAFATAKMGTWDWDLRNGAIFWLPPPPIGASLAPSTHRYVDFLAMVHPEDRERVDAEFQQVLASGEYFSSEFRIVLPDTSVSWVLSLGRVERDDTGIPVRMRGIEMDITARKEAEAALQASERRFRALVQNSFNLITIYDRHGTLLYASPSI